MLHKTSIPSLSFLQSPFSANLSYEDGFSGESWIEINLLYTTKLDRHLSNGNNIRFLFWTCIDVEQRNLTFCNSTPTAMKFKNFNVVKLYCVTNYYLSAYS